ncbi:MAG: cyclic nucleotide-binding domain-containing protein [Anaerolineae bacterium]|nr:MAG: cyclic nucleotide-binding domain-containing protein [Anaerolineae bacterium]
MNAESVALSLTDRLAAHPLLADLPDAAIADLAQAVRVLEILPDTVIIRQGEIHHSLYLVDKGKLRISIRDTGGSELNLATLNAGDFVGETSFMTKGPRTATVRALTPCRLFEFSQREMYRFRRYPELWKRLEETSQERLAISMLCRVVLFRALTPNERAEVASLLTLARYPAGTAICQEGSSGDAFFIITRGQVKVTTAKSGRQRVLAYLHEDDFFGEGALLAERPRDATVTTLTDLEALRLAREDFIQLVSAKPSLEQAIRAVTALRTRPSVDVRLDSHWSAAMNLLAEQGLTLEDQVLVRQADLCPPGCHLCEEACAARFGRSRIRLGGRRFGPLDLMSICQHCTHAACIEACFFDAIRRDENGLAHIVTSACTGCTLCEHACPHGAVTMIQPEPEELRGWLKWLLAALTQRPPEMVAEICERCHGHDDMACLNTCPTGALQLVTVGYYLRPKEQPPAQENQTAMER